MKVQSYLVTEATHSGANRVLIYHESVLSATTFNGPWTMNWRTVVLGCVNILILIISPHPNVLARIAAGLRLRRRAGYYLIDSMKGFLVDRAAGIVGLRVRRREARM